MQEPSEQTCGQARIEQDPQMGQSAFGLPGVHPGLGRGGEFGVGLKPGVGLEQFGDRVAGGQGFEEGILRPDPITHPAQQGFMHHPGQLCGRGQDRGVDRIQGCPRGEREPGSLLQGRQGRGDRPTQSLHIEPGAATSGSLFDEFPQFDLLRMAGDA